MNKQIKISSQIDNLSIVESLIDDISVQYNIGSEIYGNIIVALIEAVTNSIIHGNKLNADKSVTINYEVKDNIIEFVVIDQGNGFDYQHVPDPTLPGNMEKPNGRGVFLMSHLTDEMFYRGKGNEVVLKFKII